MTESLDIKVPFKNTIFLWRVQYILMCSLVLFLLEFSPGLVPDDENKVKQTLAKYKNSIVCMMQISSEKQGINNHALSPVILIIHNFPYVFLF